MRRPIGYYVHNQGDGHRQRALAIARQLEDRLTLLGTGLQGRCEGMSCVELPDDRGGDAAADGSDGPQALHYAPAGHDGLRRRTAAIAGWIAVAKPALIVVDVSVEVAMLARLAATPTVYVRLSGQRSDPPHTEAFRAAAALLAPFHAKLDDDATAPDIRRKTFYAPGLLAPAGRLGPVEDDLVLGVVGRGGGSDDGERWASAARATPFLRWRVVGPCSAPADAPPNLQVLGWVDDAAEWIARARVVVGGAGDGLVGAVIAAGRPFVCCPEPRPFSEQVCKAARLAALGAAVTLGAWPSPQLWPDTLARARRLNPGVLRDLSVPDGAERAASWLIDLAERQP